MSDKQLKFVSWVLYVANFSREWNSKITALDQNEREANHLEQASKSSSTVVPMLHEPFILTRCFIVCVNKFSWDRNGQGCLDIVKIDKSRQDNWHWILDNLWGYLTLWVMHIVQLLFVCLYWPFQNHESCCKIKSSG